jgi:hypothetical protein
MTAAENDVQYAYWLAQPENQRLVAWCNYQNTLRRIETALRKGDTETQHLEYLALRYWRKFVRLSKSVAKRAATPATPAKPRTIGPMTYGERANRLAALQLSVQDGPTLAELQQRIGVSLATIYRDVELLVGANKLRREGERVMANN